MKRKNKNLKSISLYKEISELDFILEKLAREWNSKSFELFKSFYALEGDMNPWKNYFDSYSVPISHLTTNYSSFNWNKDKNRINSIYESISYLKDNIFSLESKYKKIEDNEKKLNSNYLARTFLSLFDTPSSYQSSSILRFDSSNSRLVFVPFEDLEILSETEFLAMTDTQLETIEEHIQIVDDIESSLEDEYKGYISRRKIYTSFEDLTISELEGSQILLVLDSTISSININMDQPQEDNVVIHFACPDLTNPITLIPLGVSINGDVSDFIITENSTTFHYNFLENDYKKVGDDS